MFPISNRMKLLIVTQAVDAEDPVLGFFHRWIEEFAKHCEQIEIICLKEGKHSLPANVRVHSLGKPASRIKYVWNFYRYIFSLNYDAVFVHMNAEYVVLGGPLWKILGKRVVLWYAHRAVSLKLRIAVTLADAVATPAPESLRIKSEKITITGHGIDTATFASRPIPEIQKSAPRIISVGRITPIKNLETLVEAVALLRNGGILATADLIGATVTPSDIAYEKRLHALVEKLKLKHAISFLGSRPNIAMPEIYSSYDISVNLCPTGGLDKAVLESMAVGLPTMVSNEAFKTYFGIYTNRLVFSLRDSADLAKKLKELVESPDVPEIQRFLRQKAYVSADVNGVVSAIISLLHGADS